MPSFWGSPGTTNVIQTRGTAGTKPPGFDFAKWLSSQLPGLMNSPFPTYQGNLDPGLSPTMQDVIRRAQGYSQSSAPEILAGAQGSLGRFMNPTFLNPWNRLFGGGSFGGAPNYMGVNPNQRVYGGGTAQDMTFHGSGSPAMGGPMSTSMVQGGGGNTGQAGQSFSALPYPFPGGGQQGPAMGGGYTPTGMSQAGTAHGGQATGINTSVNPWAGGTFNRDAMAGRYGANWQAGAPGAHDNVYRDALRETMGREPTPMEVADAYYSQDKSLLDVFKNISGTGPGGSYQRPGPPNAAMRTAQADAARRAGMQPPPVPVPNMPGQ